MTLYIDADALVNQLKPIITKAIKQYNIPTYLVANKKVSLGTSKFVTFIMVEQGINKADSWIIDHISPGDITITSDIPLADAVVSKGAVALDQRGILYSSENIKHHLAMRNLMESIRNAGNITKGPKPFSNKDKAAFANALSSFLQKRIKN